MNELVLVVDDNDANRSMMVDVLGHWGYRTVEAANGMAAVTVANEELPDIILLDVMLPGLNGYEVCRQLKQSQKLGRIPIVMLTVLDDSEARTRAINVGADLFVSKPPNYKELHKNIGSLLNNSKRFREMESLEGIEKSLNRLVEALSPETFEQYRTIMDRATKTAKLLGMGEEQVLRLSLCGLACALGQIMGQESGRPTRLSAIIEPLNLSSWPTEYLEYQANPVVAHAADTVPVVYFICEKYQGLLAQGMESEEALARLQKAATGHNAQVKVLEALVQTIRDEEFLASFRP